ncbi:hypothetical protein ACSSS7_002670 [Eimeria intestinalis]
MAQSSTLIYCCEAHIDEVDRLRGHATEIEQRLRCVTSIMFTATLNRKALLLLPLSGKLSVHFSHSTFVQTIDGVLRHLGEGEGEGDDDPQRRQSPAIAELCHPIGEWKVDSPSTGESRASPGLVEAILASLEAEAESADGGVLRPSPSATPHESEAVLSGTGLKRVLYRVNPDEEETPGPSAKVARTGTPVGHDYAVSPFQFAGLGILPPQAPRVPLTQYQAHSSFYTQSPTSSAFLQQPYVTYAPSQESRHAAAWSGAASVSVSGGESVNLPGSEGANREEAKGLGWQVVRPYTSPGFEHAGPPQQSAVLGSLLPQTPQIPTQYQPHSWAHTEPSTSSAIPQQSYATHATLPASQDAAGSSGAASASGEGSSNPPGSSLEPAASSVSDNYSPQRNPPVRLPVLQPGVVARSFVPGRLKFPLTPLRSHASTVLEMRKIFLKDQLNQRSVDKLVYQAEILGGHAFTCMSKPIFSFPLYVAVEHLARRYLVFRALYLTAHVVKQNWFQQQWWIELGNAVPTDCNKYVFPRRSSPVTLQLALDLSRAIDMYKQGLSPSLALEVDLMKRLFCSESPPRELRNAMWDPWRHDYEDSPEDPS